MRNKLLLLSIGFFLVLSSFDTVPQNQLFPTKLRITVRNNLGNVEEGVAVKLYANEEDYRDGKNVIEQQTTDKKGRVMFKSLERKDYFIHATKGDMDNVNNGVQTGNLEEGKVNKVVIIIS